MNTETVRTLVELIKANPSFLSRCEDNVLRELLLDYSAEILDEATASEVKQMIKTDDRAAAIWAEFEASDVFLTSPEGQAAMKRANSDTRAELDEMITSSQARGDATPRRRKAIIGSGSQSLAPKPSVIARIMEFLGIGEHSPQPSALSFTTEAAPIQGYVGDGDVVFFTIEEGKDGNAELGLATSDVRWVKLHVSLGDWSTIVGLDASGKEWKSFIALPQTLEHYANQKPTIYPTP